MAEQFVYRLIIYRVDNNHMVVYESDDINQVESVFNGVNQEWVDSTAEKRPFRLPPPAIHSMLPALISEVIVEKISVSEHQRVSNPYYDQMKREGVTGVMNRNFNTKGSF